MLIFHFQFAVDPLLPLLVVMLLTMELTLEAMELLDGTLTTPTLLELMRKDAVKKGLQNRFLGATKLIT